MDTQKLWAHCMRATKEPVGRKSLKDVAEGLQISTSAIFHNAGNDAAVGLVSLL
jgi:hypothetical protein